MGYYTRYDLSVEESTHKAKDIITYMKRRLDENDWFYAFEYDLNKLFNDYHKDSKYDNDTTFYLDCDDECKWYDHKEQMLELSKQFPDTLFELHGIGEENEDVWNKYFKNGKMQACYAELVIPPYDENELK